LKPKDVVSERLPIPALTPLVLRAVRTHAGALGLRADRVAVEYVLNWGGFGNAAYNAGDGARRVHLKLAPDPDGQDALRRWQAVRTILEGRYHTPAMLGWLTVPGTTYQGPVFAFIDGPFLDGFQQPGVLDEVLRVVERLHADEELARVLAAGAPARTHLDCLVSRYTRMLREDLEAVRAEPPPFVPPGRVRWMGEQVDLLELPAWEGGAFGAAARDVVHGDLWWNNILVRPSGAWHILDWDDVGLGDPALDFATVLFPLTVGPTARRWQDFPIPAGDEAFAARMALYRRAQVLDWVIDVLADWIECRDVPAVRDAVRARKQAEHERFLRVYEADYGRGQAQGTAVAEPHAHTDY
jgi:hypothetical protein